MAIEIAKNMSGNPRILSAPEGASQTFLKGALLAWSSGYVVEASTDETRILGIAAAPGQNTTAGAAKTLFYPLQGNIFEANLAQAATDTTSAATDQGTAYGITIRSTGTTHWIVDSSKTTTYCRCRILGFAEPSVATDVDARVLITFFAANDELAAMDA